MYTVRQSKHAVLGEDAKMNLSFFSQQAFDEMIEFTIGMIFSISDLLCISFYKARKIILLFFKCLSGAPVHKKFWFSVSFRNKSFQKY